MNFFGSKLIYRPTDNRNMPNTRVVSVVLFLFLKDTFNKLGYKAKINTHTTSYIN